MQKKIKLLFMIDAIETERAGTEGQVIKLINNMNKKDFECHLGIFKYSEWVKRNKIGFNIFSVGTANLSKFDFYKGIIRLYIYIKENNIDVVSAYFPTSITIGVLISKIAGVKYIVSSRRDMGFWKNNFISSVLRISNKFVTMFLVNSHVVKNNIMVNEKIESKKIAVIYNGLEIQNISNIKKYIIRNLLNINDNDIVVGTIANLNREVKRIDVFIECAKYIMDKHPIVKFIIIGDGHLKEKYYEFARQLKISDNIIFVGSVSNPQDYASIFNVAINSSDSEGFSNAVLEYMALGIPTVATDVSGNSEIITHQKNGILVPPGNPKIMADAVINIINDRKLRDYISVNAKMRGREFSLSLMVEKHEYFIKNLMQI